MSLGGGELDNQDFKARVDHLAARADADRLARMAGYKSPFRRLLDRLRPHRQQPGADALSPYGNSSYGNGSYGNGSYGNSDETGRRLWPRRSKGSNPSS